MAAGRLEGSLAELVQWAGRRGQGLVKLEKEARRLSAEAWCREDCLDLG